MALILYNTLTRRKEPFEPIAAGNVRMYCCGVTVYDYCHLGHARSYIGWDTVRRYLQWRGYDVRYVQNFTDIDDKILNRAKQEGSSMQEVADRYIAAYFEDLRRLNVLDADEYPRATEHIPEIHQLIQTLIDNGQAYAADGDVYYRVEGFPDYGKLSGRDLDQMQAGASGRVGAEEPESARKKHPFDFALWKAAKPGEPAWDSPWGPGRPGWHIECSAMIRSRLGDSIDIHGGGGDLIFPHHENEIAQSEAVTHQPLARYWLHNGMVNVGGEKMSKSLGNFTTIRQLLDSSNAPDPMAVRLFVLQANYRKPIDFTDAAMAAAQNGWTTLKEALLLAQEYGQQLGWNGAKPEILPDAKAQFQAAMDDDFNTSGALAVVFELAKEIRRERNVLIHQGHPDADPNFLRQQWQTLVELAQVLGLEVSQATLATETTLATGLSEAEIEQLIQQRLAAKTAKNFAEADRIRTDLQAQGITLIDQPGGVTRWHQG